MAVERNRTRKAGQPSATAEERQVGQDIQSPVHDEWLLDEALAETFPASDPISPTRDDDRSGRTPGQGNWTVSGGDTRGYAREIASLVDWLGADHVGIGTDIEGMGAKWSVNDYSDVRRVVEALEGLRLPASAIEQVAGGNYARVLKTALNG